MDRQQLDLPGFFGEQPELVDGDTRERLDELHKGELHLHLNGALPLALVQELLTDEAPKIPKGFDIERDLVRRTACRSLAEYLIPWQILRLFPKRLENLYRMADAVLAELAAQRVRFAEIRSSVLYLAALQQCRPTEALERLIHATGVAAQRHGVRRGLILTVTRGDYSAVSFAALLQAYADLGAPRDVVGIDLAGDEEIPFPIELPALFRDAKQKYGLGITIHAGETGRVENIRYAVEQFEADRIGHGTAAGRDSRLMEFLAKSDICVEVCPISNRLTGAVPPDEAHPLREFHRAGVPFVICSDNPGIHQRGLTDDLAVAINEGISMDDLQQQHELAKRYSFIEDIE